MRNQIMGFQALYVISVLRQRFKSEKPEQVSRNVSEIYISTENLPPKHIESMSNYMLLKLLGKDVWKIS